MKNKHVTDSPSLFTRRQAIRGAAGLGAASFLGCGPAGASDRSRTQSLAQGLGPGAPRVAILGAGAGGIAAAYFLSGECDVTIFEARNKIGGHCDTQVVSYQGQPVTVDLGAEFFHPATHPIYVTLLEQLGLYNAANPGTDDQTLAAPGGLDIFPTRGFFNTFSSTYPELTPVSAVDFVIYSELARGAVLGNMSWDTPLSTWIEGLAVDSSFKNDILFPWITSLIGTTRANAAGTTARSILQTYALAFPANFLQGATTYNSKIGLQGNLQVILSNSPGTATQLNAAVQSLAFDGSTWTVTTSAGVFGPFDAVVVNAPPHVSKGFLASLPWAADIVSILNTYRYFDSTIMIHTDPVYEFWDRDFWTAYNGEVNGGECEGSVWLGAIQPKLPNGNKVDVFKSWVNERPAPKQILLQRTFQHPLITPAENQAIRALNGVQGYNGLYFSGQHTTGMDSQEACVWSAMQVAAQLAPSSATLASLNAALQTSGLTGISYLP
jgi:predicted NAD/FAD-binding protein